eukprot:jgi/Chlat1/5016/Chrsp32S04938
MSGGGGGGRGERSRVVTSAGAGGAAAAAGSGTIAAAAVATTSATATTTIVQGVESGEAGGRPQSLRLALAPRRKKAVKWADDTVDNEGLNRRSSKKCCIYHKPRAFGDSSSESSGNEDEDGSDKHKEDEDEEHNHADGHGGHPCSHHKQVAHGLQHADERGQSSSGNGEHVRRTDPNR